MVNYLLYVFSKKIINHASASSSSAARYHMLAMIKSSDRTIITKVLINSLKLYVQRWFIRCATM